MARRRQPWHDQSNVRAKKSRSPCGGLCDAQHGGIHRTLEHVSMIGMVLVTHGLLATEFKAALEHVVGPQDQIEIAIVVKIEEAAAPAKQTRIRN